MFRLDKFTPGTLRVYAAALEHRRVHGHWPNTEQVLALAEAEGASVGATLVLTRYELLAEDGTVVPLGGDRAMHPPAIVHDAQTLHAILARGLATAILKSPQGKVMKHYKLEQWADAWEFQESLR